MASKGKGGGFERDISRQLSLWWTAGTRDDVFWRSSSSGGRATVRFKKGKSTYGHCGDIAATDPIGTTLIKVATLELKRGYSRHSFVDVIDAKKTVGGIFLGFIKQAIESHRTAGSYSWLLIQKRDACAAVIFVPQELLAQLERVGAFETRPTVYASLRLSVSDEKSKAPQLVRLRVMRLDHFLSRCSRDHFEQVWARVSKNRQ